MSLFFEGETVEECHAWVSALYPECFKNNEAFMDAQVDAIMKANLEARPYPEFLPGSRTRVVLRNNTMYAFDINLGVIFNIATGQILKATKTNRVGVNGKPVLVYNEGLLACFPKPDYPHVTADHINQDHHDHRLVNLRWGSASLQATNRCLPKDLDLPAIQVLENGDWVFYRTRKAYVEEKLGLSHADVYREVSHAIIHGSTFKGHHIRNWVPENIGKLHDIPSCVVGVTGYQATEYGGWIHRPNGTYTQGHKHCRGHYYSIGINKSYYQVHELTTNAFWGLRPSEYHQANHKLGAAAGSADAKDLEWILPRDNVQHAYDTGLNPNSRAVVATLKDGTPKTFSSAMNAVRYFKKEGVKVDPSCIMRACNGRLKTAGKMAWAYTDGGTSRKRKFIDTIDTEEERVDTVDAVDDFGAGDTVEEIEEQG
ncbi:hypothetical protein JKP88DRAFT_241050 [Tribonema minus]|uniref:Uncharacterized protein n=1 Tax=Tribonema minus TaxID=303371 RepID=A0A835Z691_9STRA|nr:hypothetical protein JKP88DRAFT_241050 [Tribonema minus]